MYLFRIYWIQVTAIDSRKVSCIMIASFPFCITTTLSCHFWERTPACYSSLHYCLSTEAAVSEVKSISGAFIMTKWPEALMTCSVAAHVAQSRRCPCTSLLQSIHSQGGVTPPPLTDCFLLSLLLNYFSSDSHMWVFSSLAGRLTLWRREAESPADLWNKPKCVWLKKVRLSVVEKDKSS